MLVRWEDHPRAEVQRAQLGGGGEEGTAPGPPASPASPPPVSLCPEGSQSPSQAHCGNIWLIPKPSLSNPVLADVQPSPWWGRQHPLGPTCPPTSHTPTLRWERPGGRDCPTCRQSDTLTNQQPHLLDQLSLHNRQKAGAHQLGPGPRDSSSPRPLTHGTLQGLCAKGLISLAYNPPGP